MLTLLEVWEFGYRTRPTLTQPVGPVMFVQATGLNYDQARHAFNCRYGGARIVVVHEKRASSIGPA